MINGMQNNEVTMILSAMELSKFEFQLTGSRFFGTATEGSDWDFFVADSTEVRQFLVEHGFVLLTPNDYSNPDYKKAREHGKLVDLYLSQDANKSLHVQVIKDFEHKKMLNEKLLLSNFMRVEKEYRTRFWELAYSLLPE